MPGKTLIVGNDGANTIAGGAGDDVIYGYNPNGPQGAVSAIAATRIAAGLSQPVFVTAAPGDYGRLFVVEKGGLIKILDLASGQILPTPFLNVASEISTASESGLLGLAFDPDFIHNGRVYVDLVNTSGDTEIRRYQVSAGNPNVADPSSATPIITIDQPSGLFNHKAGWLSFGPDGDLYAALGDGGGGGDPFGNGQNINTLLGKIVRLDVSGDGFPGDPSRNYIIPADNPFVGVAGADEIWALGLRNPWRNSFDRALGDFYIADVGQGTWEEIDLGVAGANYGWNVMEGPATYAGGTPTGGSAVAPIYAYDHSVGQAVIGGYVYRGSSEGLQGQYFFADEVAGKIFTMRFSGGQWVAQERTGQITPDLGTINSPSSFGEDAAGNLYVVDFDGEIFRLTPTVVSADQGDILSAAGGNDVLYGGSGNDSFAGGSGDDVLNGGRGRDTAAYSGNRSSYTVTRRGLATTVDGPDGTDTLASIEMLQFADSMMPLPIPRTDLDGSGTSDILWRNGSTGDVEFWRMSNSQRTSFAIAASSTDWDVVGLGDFDGDDTADVLWRNPMTGAVGEWQMINGRRTWLPIATSSTDWGVAGIGDFHGDGTSDILWRNPTTGAVGEWQMTNGQRTWSAIAPSATDWGVAGIGDFNGDGTSDILWRNPTTGAVGQWQMSNGQRTWLPIATSSTEWGVAGVGDFNGDGTSDILWRQPMTGAVGQWQMSNGQRTWAPIAMSSTDWGVVGIGDYNGDGTSDILWRQPVTGAVGEWQMSNGQRTWLPIATSSTAWQVASS
jgi:glucose/arabinose dehydrogenase